MTKKLLFIVVLFISYAASAQEMKATLATPIPCTGITQEDMQQNWQVSMSPVAKGSGPIMPHKDVIDRIKQAKLAEKLLLEGPHTALRTTAISPTRGVNFTGNLNDGSPTQDNSIAISNGGLIVSVSNARINMYNSAGASLYSSPINAWLPYGTRAYSNPQVMYDVTADKYVFTCQSYPVSDTSKVFVAFSRSNNPTAGWYCYMVNGDPLGTSLGFDFPRIGINDSELFITGNLYNSPGTSSVSFNKPMIFQMNKINGYAGAALNYVYYSYVFGNPTFMLPLSDGQSTLATGMHMVSTKDTGGSTFSLYKITGNWARSPSITYSTVNTATYRVPADAAQLGSTDRLDVGDCRALSGFYLNGYLHFAFNCDAGSGFSGISYHRVDPVTLADSMRVLGASGADNAYPSVVSYATRSSDPTVIIGYVSTSASTYPDIRAVQCDSTLVWSGTTVVKASPTFISGTGGTATWGSYTGTCRKHNSTAPSIWMNAMYANAGRVWETYISEIHDSVNTPCPAPTTLSTVTVTATTARVSWTAVPGAPSYNINYRPVGSGTWLNATATVTNVLLTALLPMTNYEFQVQTVCPGPNYSVYSASGNFNTLSNAVEETYLSKGITLYPNPANDQCTIRFQVADPALVKINITDVTGTVVKQLYYDQLLQGMHECSFSTQWLASGTYHVHVYTNNRLIHRAPITVIK